MFEMPACETLLTERVGEHVLLVTMNRPDVLNAMNMQMTRETHDLLKRLTYDLDWVRCVVLTGAGRACSAGGDRKVRNTHSIRDWTIQHQIAERVANCAPLSVRQAKKAMHFGLQTDLHSGCRLELEAYYRLLDTEDRHEGIAAFNEKRKANFKGR